METIAEMLTCAQNSYVTGGGKGIGRAIADRLAEAGAAVMIADIDLDAAAKAVQSIQRKGWQSRSCEMRRLCCC